LFLGQNADFRNCLIIKSHIKGDFYKFPQFRRKKTGGAITNLFGKSKQKNAPKHTFLQKNLVNRKKRPTFADD